MTRFEGGACPGRLSSMTQHPDKCRTAAYARTRESKPLFRVISLNANGIRAAARKGFFEWLEKQDADVVCVQETKAQEHQLVDECFRPTGYHCYYEDAIKKGYSGTAVYTRHEPRKVVRGWGVEEFDNEGRYLEVQLDGVSVVSLYLPSGSSNDLRQESKWRFLDAFTPYLQRLRRRRAEYILSRPLEPRSEC